MYDPYISMIVLALLAIVIGASILVLTRFLGPSNPTESKLDTFETGNEPEGDARERFSIRFYLVAILFILFDIEVVFLFPWAVLFRDYISIGMGTFVFVEMVVFVGILAGGLAYVWRKGALEWD
ncbi:MAG: NADH-quinone oxidoreductase subunit A [Bradymonadia bacterium]